MTVVDQGDPQGRQDIGFPVRGAGHPRQARCLAQFGGRGGQVAEFPERQAGDLVRDRGLVGREIDGKDRARLRECLTGTSADQRQQIENPGGAAAWGRAASHVIDVKPGY